ncbi:sensor domain-containing diguanylate cyclase [Cobetia amphilecti]|uniref:Sensor domain-containing diguanylate cyclase n=1 Tax=Cobetia amphilecti TaxID=1055104 RepID=A0AAP4TW69_9GAMM|nr:sensor domain-containing diguanylate cyclase [Cobetia amphilecti]MDO6670647.1 sensor domain-containing diguanylate cyclase [Cobetia amphilecti]
MSLANLRFRTINIIICALSALAGLVLLVVLAFITRNVSDLQRDWQEYQQARSDKPRLEGQLTKALGYGGMVHDFKNLVLRQDLELIGEVQNEIGAARSALSRYQNLGLTQGEENAVAGLRATISRYELMVPRIRTMIEQGRSSADIDKLVQIDDFQAVSGLDTLRRISIAELRDNDNPLENGMGKARLVANLRRDLGYGEMIHHFKNYVLRSDAIYGQQAAQDIESLRATLAAYRALGMNTAEQRAIRDIADVIQSYGDRLNKVNQLHDEQADLSPREIDQLVKVNDAPALDALAVLDHESRMRIAATSAAVGKTLKLLATVAPVVNGLALAMIVVLIGISMWLFGRYVLVPIRRLTQTMNTLANDDVSVVIDSTQHTNEVGQMARALQKFKYNIIESNNYKKRITQLAMHDSLTGLPNRQHFYERVEHWLESVSDEGGQLACLMLDIDKFKPINDTHGHAAGDVALKVIAERLNQVVRKGDFVARLGGDEFVVLVHNADIQANLGRHGELAQLAQRIIDSLGKPFLYEEHKLEVGCSIGIAIAPQHGSDREQLSHNADMALYAAKHEGRNCAVQFSRHDELGQIVAIASKKREGQKQRD